MLPASKFEAFIFDIDGTLTSTNELIFATFNHITQKYSGKSYTNEEIIALFGPTEEQILTSWYGDKAEEVIAEYYKFYTEKHDEMVKCYEGIPELLDKLKLEGCFIAAFTGKGRYAALTSLQKCNILQYFDMVVSGSDVEKQKPSGEGILRIIDELRMREDAVLMIGDSVADIKAAKEAAIPCASVLWDSYGKEEIEKMSPDFKFYTVKELSDYLLAR